MPSSAEIGLNFFGIRNDFIINTINNVSPWLWFLHQFFYSCPWEWEPGGDRLFAPGTIGRQQGLVGKYAQVDRLPDGEEGRRLYLNVLEPGVSDLDHCRQMVPHEVSAEADSLAFDVVVCFPHHSEEICDQVNYLHPRIFFIHDHDDDEVSHGS